ncbi:hypothetical protein F4604DRAFT_1678444 [Suillus subluteus]|nr:hypothetical protein F4604DRAFT_1678444 [Suillus subluteus]
MLANQLLFGLLSVHSPQKTQQKLTEDELLVLQSHLEEWKEATGKDRKAILSAVIKEAKMQAPKMDARLLKRRKSMYRDWLYNRRAEKTLKKESKFGKKWTAQLVIERQYKKEILDKTGARPGGKEMIKNYQGAVNAIMGSLSEEQLEEAKKTAIEWSRKAPPTDVQAEFAQKKAPAMMKDLATQLWRQTSMRIFILSTWRTEEGEVRINGIDFNEKLEGNSFTDTKDWKRMLLEWNAYAGEEFVKYLHHVVIPAVDRNDDEDGNEEGDTKESRKQRHSSQNTTRVDRATSQKPKASVPWSAVREAQDDFIEHKFLPTGGKIKDPSKLQLHEANRLLEFWHQRQKDKVRPTFEFKGWQDHDKEKTNWKVNREVNWEVNRKVISEVDQEVDWEVDRKVIWEVDRKVIWEVDRKVIWEVDRKGGTGVGQKSTGKSCGKPTGRAEQESSSGGENGDEDEGDEGVQLPPSKFKSIGKRGRAVQSDSEEDSCQLVKKSKPNVIGHNRPLEDNAGTPSVESSSNHSTAPLPSNIASGSRPIGPTSAIRRKKPSQQMPEPKPKATSKKTKRHGAEVDNPEPKRSTRAAKVSYKVNYMQRV